MIVFSGVNINSVYLEALSVIRSKALTTSDSRAGKVFDLGPAFFEFTEPRNQFLTLRKRNYNPYFAMVEASWILSGSNNLDCLKKIISNYDKYSDDGHSLNGAYGYRIQEYFQQNQLDSVVNLLTQDPSSRRAVITMFCPDDLINNSSRDIPCNISICFKIRNSKLDITIINRSNDIFLGIPYNVFVFNLVQRHVAEKLGINIGVQRHFTDSLHLYERDFKKTDEIIAANTPEEISEWQNLPCPDYIYESILKEPTAIANMSLEDISCIKTRRIFSNYLKCKAQVSSLDFLQGISYDDQFEISSKLWTESKTPTTLEI